MCPVRVLHFIKLILLHVTELMEVQLPLKGRGKLPSTTAQTQICSYSLFPLELEDLESIW